jgi:hypothetical protein
VKRKEEGEERTVTLREPRRLGVRNGRERAGSRENVTRLLSLDGADDVPPVFRQNLGAVHSKEGVGSV